MPRAICSFCTNELPMVRHPNQKFCSNVCFQRNKYNNTYVNDGIKCLDCGKRFVRVGSHVVQVHNYESVLEYKWEHGLMSKETRKDNYADKMRKKASTYDNLRKGAITRFKKNGNHGEYVSNFWFNRKNKSEYKLIDSNYRGNKSL